MLKLRTLTAACSRTGTTPTRCALRLRSHCCCVTPQAADASPAVSDFTFSFNCIGEVPLAEAVTRAREAGRKYIKVASQELSGEG